LATGAVHEPPPATVWICGGSGAAAAPAADPDQTASASAQRASLEGVTHRMKALWSTGSNAPFKLACLVSRPFSLTTYPHHVNMSVTLA
jgi:hypothetical protein